jgi:FkbM family methyltransferase
MTGPEHNFLKFVKPTGDMIYCEVGASFGQTAVLLPASVKKILIEPEPRSADILQAMVNQLELKNTIIVRTGVSSKKGKVLMRVMGKALNCSRLIESPTHKLAVQQHESRKITGPLPGEPKEWTEEGEPSEWLGYTIEVEVDTLENILDSLGIDHIDLLSSDCEGQEFDMVNYAGKWMDPKKIHNWAIAAYHIAGREGEIFDVLKKAGYRIETDLGGYPFHGDPDNGKGQLVIFGLNDRL